MRSRMRRSSPSGSGQVGLAHRPSPLQTPRSSTRPRPAVPTPRATPRSLRRRDPAWACRVAAGDFEGLSCRGDDVDFQRDRKTGNRSRNVPPAPSVGGFLSAGVARTLGSNSPSRRTDLACPVTPSPGMQDMDSVTRNHLAPTRSGGGSRFEVALPGTRHAAPGSLLPYGGTPVMTVRPPARTASPRRARALGRPRGPRVSRAR